MSGEGGGFLSEATVGGSRVGTGRIKTKEQNALGSKGRGRQPVKMMVERS